MLYCKSGCNKILKQAVQESEHPHAPDSNLFQPTSVMALFTSGVSYHDLSSVGTFPVQAESMLILIQKADIQGYPWRNQMAFPGGHCEEGDPSREATALRELEEELNIPPHHVEMIGSIGHFQTIKSKDIEAFVGIWEEMGDIRFDPMEISRVFRIPFRHLLHVHKEKNFTCRHPGLHELVYPYKDVVIWGVTAKIIHHLLEILLIYPTPSCDV